MASYAELQPMPLRSPTHLRIELPDAKLREIKTQHGCSWIGGLLRVTAECGHPTARQLLSRVAAVPHRVVVDFCVMASTPGDPPTQINRWVGENGAWSCASRSSW